MKNSLGQTTQIGYDGAVMDAPAPAGLANDFPVMEAREMKLRYLIVDDKQQLRRIRRTSAGPVARASPRLGIRRRRPLRSPPHQRRVRRSVAAPAHLSAAPVADERLLYQSQLSGPAQLHHAESCDRARGLPPSQRRLAARFLHADGRRARCAALDAGLLVNIKARIFYSHNRSCNSKLCKSIHFSRIFFLHKGTRIKILYFCCYLSWKIICVHSS